MRTSSTIVGTTTVTALLVNLVPFTGLNTQADGTPIRIQTAAKPGKWITGQAIGITPESVGIISDKSRDTLKYAWSDLHQMDVSAGRRSNAGRGALIGGAVGGGVMLALGVVCVAGTDEGDITGCGGSEVALFTVAGAASGAAVGALIGATSHREKWATLELEPHLSAGLRGRRGVGLTFEF
jgi:hypothetical protein